MVMRELQKEKMTLASVPRLGQLVSLRATSNVHTGGDVVDATDEISSEENQFAENAARAFPGLYMGGFDVLLARDGKGSEPCVIEVNASPMIAMHHFPARGQVRDVAGELLSAVVGDHGGSAQEQLGTDAEPGPVHWPHEWVAVVVTSSGKRVEGLYSVSQSLA